MWIFFGIIAFIAILITAILLLPVYVIIKTDKDGELVLLYKILFKTFGENPDPNNPIIKVLKESSGISQIEGKNLKKSVKESGIVNTLSDVLNILTSLLKELVLLLKYCTLKKFELKIVCSEKDAAKTAISYGQCCSLIYPFLGLIHSIVKRTNKRGQKIDISCDYNNAPEVLSYDILVSVKLCHVLVAFIRILIKEAKRTLQNQEENEETATQKNP